MNNTPLYVDLVELRELIRIALREDIGTGDVTTESTIPVNTRARGVFKAKESGVLAGIQVMDIVFEEVDPSPENRMDLRRWCTDPSWPDPGVGSGLGPLHPRRRTACSELPATHVGDCHLDPIHV